MKQAQINEIESESEAVCNLHECIKRYAKLNEGEVFTLREKKWKVLRAFELSAFICWAGFRSSYHNDNPND